MSGGIKGKWALVTGASSGLGVDFARELAARGANIVLVARRADLMHVLANDLVQRHGIQTEVVAMDLGCEGAAEALRQRLGDGGREVEILVNNAGFGLWGRFLATDWTKEREMLQVDIVALVHLTKLFARDMEARRSGYILLVSSIGAFQPTPLYATYSAAKSFVLSFGEALRYELRGTGVSCTVLCPGVTHTEFLAVSGQRPTLYQRLTMMKSPAVAKAGVRAMLRRRRCVVPGVMNDAWSWMAPLLPRPVTAAIAHATMR